MADDGPYDDFSLLETMRLEEGRVVRQQGHLSRMAGTARAHGFVWDEARVVDALAQAAAAQPTGRWRLRLLLDRAGVPKVERQPFPPLSERPWRVALARDPVDGNDLFLRIKSTRRQVYDAARRAHPDMDDVVLWTPSGEITESTIANVVVDLDDALYTPPATGPLLPGVFRAELLQQERIRERAISTAEALAAARIWLVNSVREWIDAEWANVPEHSRRSEPARQ
jgi:branched-subunit amino acid aminotransferase/4-amino-4-deoxychorismate lyase